MDRVPNAGPGATPHQRQLFSEYLRNKDAIDSVTEVRPGVFSIKKRGHSPILVQLVDIYTVSELDVARLRDEEPTSCAIVTASNWNMYTPAAKAAGRVDRVGVFNWKEFMGAVHKDGDDFLDFSG